VPFVPASSAQFGFFELDKLLLNIHYSLLTKLRHLKKLKCKILNSQFNTLKTKTQKYDNTSHQHKNKNDNFT